MFGALLQTSVLEAFVLLTCLLGDYLVTLPVAEQRLLQALVDNVTHGIIGGLSWAVVRSPDAGSDRSLVEIILCMLLSMVVDIDHFLAARSFYLKDALSLRSRPIFHSSTLTFVVVVTLLVVYFTTSHTSQSHYLLTTSGIFTIAVLSHQVRDATRRGLWFPPFGSTHQMSRPTYIMVVMSLPVLLKVLNNLWRDRMARPNYASKFIV